MAKKDISKILTTGSAKQKLLLIAEDNARRIYNKEPILTDHEFNKISESFKKPNEIKLWNEWLKHSRSIANALLNIQGSAFEVKMNYSNLRGYILVWNSIEKAELLVNSVLHEIKDPIERKRIAEGGAKGVDLLFSKTTTDKEGYIDIKIDFEKVKYNRKKLDEEPVVTKEYSLLNVMNNVKEEAVTSVIKFLSRRQAILDYMDETGFNIKTYKEILQGFTNNVYTPVIGWAKYEGEIRTGLPHPQIEKLLKKYAITPNVEDLEIDKEAYNYFKNEILLNE